MPQNLGYAFAPTFSNADLGKQGGSPPATPQGALQTLSFNLGPRVAGAPGGLSPLQGTNQAGSSISQAVLASVLRTVLGADAVSGSFGGGSEFQMPQGAPPQAPTPVVHPGGDGNTRFRVPDPNAPDRTDGPAFEDSGLTPRGTEDPTHAGLQQWIAQERQRAMPANLGAMNGLWTGYR